MNFGLNDIINNSVLGTPEKALENFVEKFQLPVEDSNKSINKPV